MVSFEIRIKKFFFNYYIFKDLSIMGKGKRANRARTPSPVIHSRWVGPQMGKFHYYLNNTSLRFSSIHSFHDLYFYTFSVTRARKRLFKKHKIKDCFVALERNIPMEVNLWIEKPRPILNRRASVAGGQLYSVDGTVQETGTDFLSRVRGGKKELFTIFANQLKFFIKKFMKMKIIYFFSSI